MKNNVVMNRKWQGDTKGHGGPQDSASCINNWQAVEGRQVKIGNTSSAAQVGGWLGRLMEHVAGWLYNHEIETA